LISILNSPVSPPLRYAEFRLNMLRRVHSSTYIPSMKGDRPMISATQIRNRLAKWLNGEISLREFEEWFVPASWDSHKANDTEAESLVDEIELNLSEYTDRTITYRELKDRLQSELVNTTRPFGKEGLVPQFARPMLNLLTWKRTDSANRLFVVSVPIL
ncbi:MAG: hypothetical protein M3Z36_13760, partial [Acidobacteriota bacterium]|nr:hypothetical protein [Acidobacteriota bacterium]